MPHYEYLPIWRDARRLLIVVEEAVCQLVIRASTTKHISQKRQLERLVSAIEERSLSTGRQF